MNCIVTGFSPLTTAKIEYTIKIKTITLAAELHLLTSIRTLDILKNCKT